MAAYSKKPFDFYGILLNAKTMRCTKNGKVAHLFVEYIDGATNGFPASFCCDMVIRHPEQWTTLANEDHSVPLCNHCGREFHKDRKYWTGRP